MFCEIYFHELCPEAWRDLFRLYLINMNESFLDNVSVNRTFKMSAFLSPSSFPETFYLLQFFFYFSDDIEKSSWVAFYFSKSKVRLFSFSFGSVQIVRDAFFGTPSVTLFTWKNVFLVLAVSNRDVPYKRFLYKIQEKLMWKFAMKNFLESGNSSRVHFENQN